MNYGDYRTHSELNQFESDAILLASAALEARPIKGPFTANRLKETHRRLFGAVYPWAGEFRKGIGMMAKNRSGFTVAYGPSENVPAALKGVFARLKAEYELKGLDACAFVQRLAFYYSELDAIPAFREGNSRTLRAFTSDLSRAAGHPMRWANAGQDTDAQMRLYRARDIAVMRGDTTELAEIIRVCIGA